jgi:hypothetical protein
MVAARRCASTLQSHGTTWVSQVTINFQLSLDQARSRSERADFLL